MISQKNDYDYVIVGGGHAGCVLASRLAQYLPNSSIALIEAGGNAHDNPNVQSALGAPLLHGTELQWNDMTAPQPGAAGRQIYHGGGKLLSGGSAVNYGMWVRGHETDFDQWAQSVGDDRWSYKSLLPLFKRTETHHVKPDECTNASEHGFDGPIHTVEAFDYPLGSTVLESLSQAGHKQLADANSGQPLGVAKFVNNWRNKTGAYVRQPAGEAYDLSKVDVLENTPVHKVMFKQEGGKPKAVAVDLGSGRQINASQEIIVSCGALRTPQVLMLSGLGNASHLQSLGIEPVLDIPAVGANFHDHCSAMLFWKLKHPEKVLAIGHPDFDPKGIAPSEWLLTATVPSDVLSQALQKDGFADPSSHPNVSTPRAHYEMTFGYYPAGAEPGVLPEDGSIMTTGISNFLPTSRGSITLRSSDVSDSPIIDPQYLTTQHDLCIMREAVRELMRILLDTPAAKSEVSGLFQNPASDPIGPDSSDEQLDEYLRKTVITWFHPAGTAAMGTVVDGDCRVKGVDGLRVVDASILPDPLAAHYQAPIYAIAEQAAQIIAGKA